MWRGVVRCGAYTNVHYSLSPPLQGVDGGIKFDSSDSTIEAAQKQMNLNHVTKPWTRDAWERARPWVLEQRQKLESSGWSSVDCLRVSSSSTTSTNLKGLLTTNTFPSPHRRNSLSLKSQPLLDRTPKMDVSLANHRGRAHALRETKTVERGSDTASLLFGSHLHKNSKEIHRL